MKILSTSLRKTKYQKHFGIIIAFGLLIILSMLSLSLGRVSIAFEDIINLIFGRTVPATTQHVIIQLRVPRLIGAIVVGAALSVSGSVYQSIFQNPLVSPDLLGVSAGACTGAAFAIIMGLNGVMITVFSFVSGIVSVALCVGLSLLTRRKSNLILLFAEAADAVQKIFQRGKGVAEDHFRSSPYVSDGAPGGVGPCGCLYSCAAMKSSTFCCTSSVSSKTTFKMGEGAS